MTDPTLPPGAPYGEQLQQELADLWCAHGVQWRAHVEGYRPTHVDELHPDIPAREAGAIPALCQPTTAYDPAQYPHAGPAAVRRVLNDAGIPDGDYPSEVP